MGEKRYIISDASKMLGVESHVLRYWEEELNVVIPRNEMGHRYYTDNHINLLKNVRDLKEQGYSLRTIKMMLTDPDDRSKNTTGSYATYCHCGRNPDHRSEY
ncbi:MAG: MerR family transcriptional regulator [Eubacterium sp.]